MTLFTLFINVNDDDIHAIRIRIKFWIDSYAFHVYLAIFLTFDPKMTLFDPFDDLGWPRDTHQWIQKKISNRSICISCAFDHISDFWLQNDLFWPLRWPRMTLRCTPLNSDENFQSIDMHIMCIWPYFWLLTPKWPFLTPKMTSDDLEMHTIEFRRKFPIDWYAYCAYSVWN